MSSKKYETRGSRKMKESERGESPDPSKPKRGKFINFRQDESTKSKPDESPQPTRFKRGESPKPKKSRWGRWGDSPKQEKSKRGESPKPENSKRKYEYPDLFLGGSCPSPSVPFSTHFTIPKLSGNGKVKIDQGCSLGRTFPKESPIRFQTFKMESSADGYGETELNELLSRNCSSNGAASDDGTIRLHYLVEGADGTSRKDLAIPDPESDSGLGSNTSSGTNISLGSSGIYNEEPPMRSLKISDDDDAAYESDDQDILIIDLSEEEKLEILNGFPPTRPPYDY